MRSYTLSSTNGNGIGGSGTLTMNSGNGLGSATLNTINTYTGDTDVQSGTLNIGSTGSIASANSNITGGTLSVNSGGQLGSTSISISGTGAMTVASGGLLTGSNPTITTNNSGGGGLTAASGAVLPASLNLVNNGTAAFNSSQSIDTLNGTNSSAILSQVGTLTLNSGGTYQGAINNGGGTGSLTVSGTTPLVLTGSSNYSGNTTVNAGATLQIDDGNVNQGVLSPNSAVAITGTLIFARTDSAPNVGNSFTGTGLLEVNGNPSRQFDRRDNLHR